MNYFSHIIITAIIQILIFYECYCISIENFFYNLLSFICGLSMTHLIFEYINIRKIEKLLQKFDDVF